MTTVHLPDPDVDLGPFEPTDEASSFECLRTCFGVAPDPASWRHLYFANPGGEPIIIVARHHGAVVSQSTMLPRRIRAFGAEGFATHALDLMTLPGWRSRGLKQARAEFMRRIVHARKFLATFAVANEQSGHGAFKYDDFRAVGALPVLIRPLRTLQAAVSVALARLRPDPRQVPSDSSSAGRFGLSANGASRAAPPAGWSLPSFTDRHTALFGRAEGVPPVALVRDAPHLAWRYATVAGVDYLQRDAFRDGDLVATAVVRTAAMYGLHLLVVMEWFWRDDARREAIDLLSDVVRLGRALGMHGVTALAMPGTVQRQLLASLGFLAVPESLYPRRNVLIVRLEREDFDPQAWSLPSNWYLTWGDGFLL